MSSVYRTTLLDLPLPLLSHVLGFLALDEQSESFAAALLACKSLHQAADAVVRSRLQLSISSTKLELAREAGQEGQFLAFLRRTASAWRRAALGVDSEDDLRQLLLSLAPVTSSGLSELRLHFGLSYPRVGPPEEMKGLTTLTGLAITEAFCIDHQPVQFLANLSTLTALRSLKVEASFSSQVPIAALSRLQQLTRLQLLKMYGSHEAGATLGWGHLSACRELRQLDFSNVVPHLSGEQALAAWQHLEQLSIWPAHSCQDAGFWTVLSQLGSLRGIAVGGCQTELSQVLSQALPACSGLVDLKLGMDESPALPQLPTTLTSLHIVGQCESGRLPTMPMLQRLEATACRWLAEYVVAHPDVVSALTQLTRLQLRDCDLQQLPAPLAALPAVEELDLGNSWLLSELPEELACLPRLRELHLRNCDLRQVPPVLGAGLASRLEMLNMYGNWGLEITGDGLSILGSLTGLTCLLMSRPSLAIGRSQSDSLQVVAAVRQVLPISCELHALG